MISVRLRIPGVPDTDVTLAYTEEPSEIVLAPVELLAIGVDDTERAPRLVTDAPAIHTFTVAVPVSVNALAERSVPPLGA